MTTCQTAAKKVCQEMIKQGQCVCVRLSESHYHSPINLQLYVTD